MDRRCTRQNNAFKEARSRGLSAVFTNGHSGEAAQTIVSASGLQPTDRCSAGCRLCIGEDQARLGCPRCPVCEQKRMEEAAKIKEAEKTRALALSGAEGKPIKPYCYLTKQQLAEHKAEEDSQKRRTKYAVDPND